MIFSVGTNKKSDFDELWQHCKQLKTMDEAWPNIYNERYIHQCQPERTHNSLAAAETLNLKMSSYGTSLKWSRRSFQSAQE